MAVRENQNINMSCRADGFPAPKIIWRREDGEEIAVEKKKKGKYSEQILLNKSVTGENKGTLWNK